MIQLAADHAVTNGDTVTISALGLDGMENVLLRSYENLRRMRGENPPIRILHDRIDASTRVVLAPASLLDEVLADWHTPGSAQRRGLLVLGDVPDGFAPGDVVVAATPRPLRSLALRVELDKLVTGNTTASTATPAPAVPHNLQLLGSMPPSEIRAINTQHGPLLFDFEQDTVWGPPGQSLRDFANWPAAELVPTPVSPEQASRATLTMAEHPLTDFLWDQAIRHSRGGLLRAVRHGNRFRLRRFPAFNRVTRRDWMQAIIVEMVALPATLAQIREQSGRPVEQVHAFLNACALCGWLDNSGAASEARREMLRHSPKIVLTGPTGSGKTTAIHAIANAMMRSMEANTSDEESRNRKSSTTTGFDFGEVECGDLGHIRLYGTPGQRRFSFMWNVVTRGALGYVLMIDNARRLPLSDLSQYLDTFGDKLRRAGAVIGITRTDEVDSPSMDAYDRFLAERGEWFPLVQVDARDGQQVRKLLNVLMLSVEAEAAH